MSYSVRLEKVELVDEANQAAGQARGRSAHFVEEVRRITSDRPLAALLAAMAIGLAAGLLVPRR